MAAAWARCVATGVSAGSMRRIWTAAQRAYPGAAALHRRHVLRGELSLVARAVGQAQADLDIGSQAASLDGLSAGQKVARGAVVGVAVGSSSTRCTVPLP